MALSPGLKLERNMIAAIERNNLRAIEKIAAKGCAKIKSNGTTFLYYVVKQSQSEKTIVTLDKLIALGFDLNAPIYSARTKTALIYCAEYNDFHFMQHLLDAGAKLDGCDADGRGFIEILLHKESYDFLAKVLQSGVVPPKKDELFNLLAGDKNVPTKIFNIIMKEDWFNPNTALIPAILHESIFIEEILAYRGLDLNRQDRAYEGFNALHAAVKKGKVDLALRLIEMGIDVRAKAKGDLTALDIAADAGHTDVVIKILQEMKKAPQNGDIAIYSAALMKAVSKTNVRITTWLVEAGAEANFTAKGGTTPLIQAVQSKQRAQVSALLALGAHAEQKDDRGLCAYDYAAEDGAMDLFQNASAAAGLAGASVSGFYKLGDQVIEWRDAGLSTVFNFSTQQVIYRDGQAMSAQNFRDIEGRDAITQAYEKLVELKGTPTAPAFMPAKKREMISKL